MNMRKNKRRIMRQIGSTVRVELRFPEWSALDESTQKAIKRMAVFPGGLINALRQQLKRN